MRSITDKKADMNNLLTKTLQNTVYKYQRFLRLFTIHTIFELSTFNRSQMFCYKIVILFIYYYNGNTRLNYVKPKLTLLIRDLLKSQVISCQLDFNSCFPLYSDQHYCNLHPRASTICGTKNTSCNVSGCSNPNAHAQFPKATPFLFISDHKEHSCYKSVITVLRLITHLNLK